MIQYIPEVKISDQGLGKYHCILGRIWAKRGVSKQISAVVKLGSSATPRKRLPSFKLENSASSTQTATKLLHNEYQLRLPYPSHIPCLKDNFHNLTKYECKETFKIPISLLFKEGNIKNSQFSIFSMNWEKLRSSARATFKNPNIQSLCELGKTWKYSLRPRFKILNFESIDEFGVTY